MCLCVFREDGRIGFENFTWLKTNKKNRHGFITRVPFRSSVSISHAHDRLPSSLQWADPTGEGWSLGRNLECHSHYHFENCKSDKRWKLFVRHNELMAFCIFGLSNLCFFLMFTHQAFGFFYVSNEFISLNLSLNSTVNWWIAVSWKTIPHLQFLYT